MRKVGAVRKAFGNREGERVSLASSHLVQLTNETTRGSAAKILQKRS